MKVQSMKEAVDVLLFHILEHLNITYDVETTYIFTVVEPDKICVKNYRQRWVGTAYHYNKELIPLVRAYNWIVYGR